MLAAAADAVDREVGDVTTRGRGEAERGWR